MTGKYARSQEQSHISFPSSYLYKPACRKRCADLYDQRTKPKYNEQGTWLKIRQMHLDGSFSISGNL